METTEKSTEKHNVDAYNYDESGTSYTGQYKGERHFCQNRGKKIKETTYRKKMG